MFKNDFLNPHIDNSHDAKRDRYRRLNLLYYVTPDWKLEKSRRALAPGLEHDPEKRGAVFRKDHAQTKS